MNHTDLWTSSTDDHNDPRVTEGDDENNERFNKSRGEGICNLFTLRWAPEFTPTLYIKWMIIIIIIIIYEST